MQPGQKSHQIERARNEVDLGPLGDPERWGAQESATLHIGGPGLVQAYTPQIIRVQCADLIARAWDMTVWWQLTGLALTDIISSIGFEVSIGAGQASKLLTLDLIAGVNGYSFVAGNYIGFNGNNPWTFATGAIAPVPNFSQGAVSLPNPLPAAAMSGRGFFAVQAGDSPARDVVGTFFGIVSPRAL